VVDEALYHVAGIARTCRLDSALKAFRGTKSSRVLR
jgi:hypothetical protein